MEFVPDRDATKQKIESLKRAVAADPTSIELRQQLGRAFESVGDLQSALDTYRQTLAIAPRTAAIRNDLGFVLMSQKRCAEAAAEFAHAVRLDPHHPPLRNNLGFALINAGQLDSAVACLSEVVRLWPHFAAASVNLGTALLGLGKMDEAIAAFNRAIAIDPNQAMAHFGLGGALQGVGQLEAAIASYRRALELQPDNCLVHQNLLYATYFHPAWNAKAIHAEHLRWSERFVRPLEQRIRPHANDRSPDRPLRIGYVSPNFSRHVVGRFLKPILEHRDRDAFRVYLYSDVAMPDEYTKWLRSNCDVWKSAVGFSDEMLAEEVRGDGIDILVDLVLHMDGSRLLAFARKPAPVQVTYLAFAGTTGMPSVDYRLTDPYLDPPGGDETCYSEKSLRLPETYWCFQPIPDSMPVSPLPARGLEHVTFGCLNNFCKVSDATLHAWREILAATPGTHLLLHAKEGRHRQNVRDAFAAGGVTPDRIEFVGMQPLRAYCQTYHRIDIALDPFPYGGGTTTCDALWMGVPVVSLAGQTAVGRAGLSILSNIGLSEFVANTPEQYIQIAVRLAANLDRLSEMRFTMRRRMESSPLMDGPRFARNIEAAYRQMWHAWCGAK